MSFRLHLRSLRNSPTSARDLSQILSPARLGIWFTCFNGAVAIAFATLFSFITDANDYPNYYNSELFTSVELGQMFASCLFATIAIYLTVFIPVRIFGFLIGPRTLRYFDQIVISGISPARYMAGKVILQNFFFLLILAASIPYLALCFSLGGVSIPFVLSSLVALWLYANLLCLVSLAMSVVTFEFVAAPCVILLFGIAIWIGFLPFPPHPFNLTPLPIFTSPVYESFISRMTEEEEFASLLTFMMPFGLLGTNLVYYALTVGFLAGCLFLFLSIGPLHAISGRLTNFASVIMPGDAKKKRIFRGHQTLRRRGEIAFFYENRPGRLRALDARLRWGMKQLVFLALFIPPLAFIHAFAPTIWVNEFLGLLVFLGCVSLAVAAFIFTRDRSTGNLHYSKWSAAGLDTLFFSISASVVFLLAFAAPVLWGGWFGSFTLSRNYVNETQLADSFIPLGLIIVAASVVLFAMAQWLSTRVWSHARAFTSALVLYGLMITIPLLTYAAIRSSARIDSSKVETAAEIANLSPIVPVGHLFGERMLYSPFNPTVWPTVVTHAVVAALFFFLAYRGRKKLPLSHPA